MEPEEAEEIAEQAKAIETEKADTELEELHALARQIIERLKGLPPPQARGLLVKLHHILEQHHCLHTLALLKEKGLEGVTYNKTHHREVIHVRPQTELTDAISVDNTPEIVRDPDTPLVDPLPPESPPIP